MSDGTGPLRSVRVRTTFAARLVVGVALDPRVAGPRRSAGTVVDIERSRHRVGARRRGRAGDRERERPSPRRRRERRRVRAGRRRRRTGHGLERERRGRACARAAGTRRGSTSERGAVRRRSVPGGGGRRRFAGRSAHGPRRSQHRRRRRGDRSCRPVAGDRCAPPGVRGRPGHLVDHGTHAPACGIDQGRGRDHLGRCVGSARPRARNRGRDRPLGDDDEPHAGAPRGGTGATASVRHRRGA